jgi:hypothetical protein
MVFCNIVVWTDYNSHFYSQDVDFWKYQVEALSEHRVHPPSDPWMPVSDSRVPKDWKKLCLVSNHLHNPF